MQNIKFNKPINILLLYTIIYLFIYYYFYLLFEDYEPFINYYFKTSAQLGVFPYEIHNENFLLNYLFYFLYRFDNTFPYYDLFRCITNIIGLSLIHYSIVKNATTPLKYFAPILLILFAIDNFVIINNVRSSGLITIGIIMFIQTHKLISKSNFLILIAILILGIICRIEIPLILIFTYSLIFFIIYNYIKKEMIWLLLITGAIYLFYLTLSLSNIDGERGFNKYERKIYNMGSSIVSKYDSDIENYSREKIINFAKVLFINDIELQKISFEEVIIHHNMKEYLLDNDSLSSHYESTILSLIDSLWVNFKYIMLSILLMGLCIGVFYRRSFFIKLILGLFACVSLILLLNLFSEINIRFASVFLLLIFCLLMNYLINAKAIIVLWLIGFIGILNYGSFRKDIYPDLLKIHKAHTSLIDLRNKLSEDGLSLYLGSINVSYAYPIKLFDRDKTVWKYLDASNMNNNSVFQKIFIDEFGEDWGRIDKRMMQIVEECGLIAMDEMYKKLFERYLELIYNMHLNFVLINHIPQSDINIYQVTIVE